MINYTYTIDEQYCSSNSAVRRRPLCCTVCSTATAKARTCLQACCKCNFARPNRPFTCPHAFVRFNFSFARIPRCCCPVCVDVVVSALFVCTVHSLTMSLFCTRNCSQEFSLKLLAPELQRNCQTPACSRTRCRGWILIRCYHYLWAFVHFCLSFDTRAVSVSAFAWTRCCLEFA